jgi:acetyltransferase-like isoleucine patch superfamily enzyme
MGYTDVEYKFKSIGQNVKIGRNVYFRYPGQIEIGDNVIIDDFCSFSTAMVIGNNVHIAPLCSVIGGLGSLFIMNHFSGMAAGVRIICSSDDFMSHLTGPTVPVKYRLPTSLEGSRVVLGQHALLGTGSIVHPSVRLCDGAATGSMTLVTKDLDPWTVYIGSPAREYCKRDKAAILAAEKEYLGEV